MEQVQHEIPPLYDGHSKILILGSFPSVKSREGHFFYNHPAESILARSGGRDGAGDAGDDS